MLNKKEKKRKLIYVFLGHFDLQILLEEKSGTFRDSDLNILADKILRIKVNFNPVLDTRISSVRSSVRSETGWTEELWSNCVLLILKN